MTPYWKVLSMLSFICLTMAIPAPPTISSSKPFIRPVLSPISTTSEIPGDPDNKVLMKRRSIHCDGICPELQSSSSDASESSTDTFENTSSDETSSSSSSEESKNYNDVDTSSNETESKGRDISSNDSESSYSDEI